MFSTSTVNGIDVESCWKKELRTASQSCQCDPYYTRDEGIQYPVVTSIAIQSCFNDSSTVCYGLDSMVMDKDIDLAQLNDFLKKGEKVIRREIRKSIKNDDDWKHINRIHGTSVMDARCLHKIYSDHLFDSDMMELHHMSPDGSKTEQECKMKELESNKYVVSTLTWNCTSSMIAVSYKVHVDHSKSWCSHQSFLCLWNLFRTLNHESKPSVVMAVDGCITCTSAHPNLATIYAIGTQLGKVFVVNSRFSVFRQTSKSTTTSKESLLESSSGNYTRSSNPGNVHHSDAVTCIHWIPGQHAFAITLPLLLFMTKPLMMLQQITTKR